MSFIVICVQRFCFVFHMSTRQKGCVCRTLITGFLSKDSSIYLPVPSHQVSSLCSTSSLQVSSQFLSRSFLVPSFFSFMVSFNITPKVFPSFYQFIPAVLSQVISKFKDLSNLPISSIHQTKVS